MKKEKTKKKEIGKRGIFYTAWTEEIIKKNPITEKHLNTFVSWAEDPKKKRYLLRKIHKSSTPQYPLGGYQIENPDFEYLQSVFLDELIPFPIKKKRKK